MRPARSTSCFEKAAFPAGVFQSLLISSSSVARVIDDPRIAAVTLTGSETRRQPRGRLRPDVRSRKPCSSSGVRIPSLSSRTRDLEAAVRTGVRARYQNTGQSCIAAKRFIVAESIFDDFQERFVAAVRELKIGDPTDRATQIGPLARKDLTWRSGTSGSRVRGRKARDS